MLCVFYQNYHSFSVSLALRSVPTSIWSDLASHNLAYPVALRWTNSWKKEPVNSFQWFVTHIFTIEAGKAPTSHQLRNWWFGTAWGRFSFPSLTVDLSSPGLSMCALIQEHIRIKQFDSLKNAMSARFLMHPSMLTSWLDLLKAFQCLLNLHKIMQHS